MLEVIGTAQTTAAPVDVDQTMTPTTAAQNTAGHPSELPDGADIATDTAQETATEEMETVDCDLATRATPDRADGAWIPWAVRVDSTTAEKLYQRWRTAPNAPHGAFQRRSPLEYTHKWAIEARQIRRTLPDTPIADIARAIGKPLLETSFALATRRDAWSTYFATHPDYVPKWGTDADQPPQNGTQVPHNGTLPPQNGTHLFQNGTHESVAALTMHGSNGKPPHNIPRNLLKLLETHPEATPRDIARDTGVSIQSIACAISEHPDAALDAATKRRILSVFRAQGVQARMLAQLEEEVALGMLTPSRVGAKDWGILFGIISDKALKLQGEFGSTKPGSSAGRSLDDARGHMLEVVQRAEITVKAVYEERRAVVPR